MDEDGPSTDELRIMAVMWAEVVRRQTPRFEESVEKFDEWRADRGFRAAYEANPSADWQSQYLEAGRSTMTQRDMWMIGAERYFLLIALAQLRKCVLRLRADNLPEVRDPKVIRLLRDIDEHWEQPVGVGRSLTELREVRPDVKPGQIVSNGKHVWIGDLSTTELLQWAEDVDQVVRRRAELDGKPIPHSGLPL